MHKQVVELGGKIFHKENFQEIFRGVENFSFPLFSEFWCFPSGFWCQNSYEGGKSAQNSKWGVENHHKDNPSNRGGKIFGNFLGGGKIFFLSMSLWLVHVCCLPSATMVVAEELKLTLHFMVVRFKRVLKGAWFIAKLVLIFNASFFFVLPVKLDYYKYIIIECHANEIYLVNCN